MAFSLLVRLWVVCAVGALVLGMALFVTTPAQAATKQEPVVEAVDPIKAATVNLYCTFSSGNKRFSSTGSGVFISERGIILTNAHVAQYFLLPYKNGKVRGSCNVRTGSPAKNQYTASVLYISPSWLASSATSTTGTGDRDFALLYITGGKNGIPASFPSIPYNIAQSPGAMAEVLITGYPTAKLSYNAVRSKLKLDSASSTVVDTRVFVPGSAGADVLTIATSPVNVAGVSGGPVTNIAGQVVGIATAVSSSKENPVLRAITLPYISRTIQSESGLPFLYYLMSDFATQGSRTAAAVPPNALEDIKSTLFKKK